VRRKAARTLMDFMLERTNVARIRFGMADARER